MSATLLRFSFCAKNLSRWNSFAAAQINRTFASRSSNLSADATAAAATSRRIELKDPIGTDKLQNIFNNEVKNGDIVPVFKRALLYGNKIAVKDPTGEYSYRQILEAARKLSTELSAHSYGELWSCDTSHLTGVVSMVIITGFIEFKNNFYLPIRFFFSTALKSIPKAKFISKLNTKLVFSIFSNHSISKRYQSSLSMFKFSGILGSAMGLLDFRPNWYANE